MGGIVSIYERKLPIAIGIGLAFAGVFVYGLYGAFGSTTRLVEAAAPIGARIAAAGATGGTSAVAEGAIRGAIGA